MTSACCIIGAGYSYLGGLPLTKDLFNREVVILSASAKKRFLSVWQNFEEWERNNPKKNPEEYLADLYYDRSSITPFAWAVELLAAVLSTPVGEDIKPINPRYHGVRITKPSRCAVHLHFWRIIADLFTDIAAVTTNYDLLIERALRHRPMKRPPSPGFFYGGFDRPQFLKGAAQPWTVQDQQKNIELTGTVPLFKIHGSLSWSMSNGSIEMFQDMRPAFRHGGQSAIVPPITEKNVPPWLKRIWREAEITLSLAENWVVCGYSLPDYDHAIKTMLGRAAKVNLKAVYILDPFSSNLRDRWQNVASAAKVFCLRGLPEGASDLYQSITGSLV